MWYEWFSRIDTYEPIMCPKCKSRKWKNEVENEQKQNMEQKRSPRVE